MIKAAAVAAALAAAAAPASALNFYNYAHTESPGSVFETNFNGGTSGTFEVTIPSPAGCASIGFDLDSEGNEAIAVLGSLSEGQSVTGDAFSSGRIANLVRAASRPGCVGFSAFASFDSTDSIFGLSQKVSGIPAGKFARITFVLSEGTAEGSGVTYTAEDGVRSLTSSVEIVDSFGCDEADVPAQCLHAQREAAPAARITSEATGGRITASSARKCVTVAVIADDGQDHQAECNYESTSDSDGSIDVKRA